MNFVECLPGTATPVPRLMTDREAAQYLRLDDGRTAELAVAALTRLVEKKLIRPCRGGRHNRFDRAELDRFIETRTAEQWDVDP